MVSSGFSPVIGGPAALPLRRGRSGCASPRPADAVDYCEREGTGCRDGAWVRDDPSGLTGSEGLAGSGWSIERPFQRMRFGRATAKPTEQPFAVAGPEFG